MLFQKEQNHGIYQIKAFNPGQIEVANKQLAEIVSYTQPILISAHSLSLFQACDNFAELSICSLKDLLDNDLEILLIGTGQKHQFLKPSDTAMLNQLGIAVETMATRQACHTFEVLQHDRRKVQALLFL